MLEPGFGPGLPAPQTGVLPITPFERASVHISKMKPTGVEPITFGAGIRRAAVAPRSRMLICDMCKMSAGTRDRTWTAGSTTPSATFTPFWRSRSAPTGIRTRAASATNWSAAVLHHWSSIDAGPRSEIYLPRPLRRLLAKSFPHRDLNPGLSRERRRC